MSLVVSAFWTNPAKGELRMFTAWNDGHQLAGTERARTDLWWSEAVRQRGAKFLPQLANSNLWVSPEELPAFVTEVRILLNDVDGLREELGQKPDCPLPQYLANCLCSAEYAAPRGVGVNIS